MSETVVYGHGWRPGVIGDIVRLHAIYYARHWQLGAGFEANVAAALGAFVESYDSNVSRLFTASVCDRLVGSLTIDGTSDRNVGARLRWFIIAGEAQGQGTGKTLMQMAMGFLAETRSRLCYLTTFAGLDSARTLYERHGFRLTDEVPGRKLGTAIAHAALRMAFGRGALT